MYLRKTLLVLFLAFFINSPASLAQSTNETVKDSDIQKTIEIIRDDKKREELIKQLSILMESENKLESDKDFSIDEIVRVDIDKESSQLFQKYKKILDRFNISESTGGNIILLALLIIGILVFYFINRQLTKIADKKITPVRKKLNLAENRFRSLIKVERHVFAWVAILLIVYAAGALFSSLLPEPVKSFDVSGITSFIISAMVIAIIFTAIWETTNAIIEYSAGNVSLVSTNRAKTILPIFRNILLSVLILLAILVTLSELGIDIMPLLAGAGVVGIAVGFGAQTLVKDFLTGFTVILEDLIRIGDVVTVGDRTGKVEKITIRKIQLRNLDGTVHTIPFGEISIVDNMTKEYSYYLMDIGVAYRENITSVIECIKKVDEELRDSEEYGNKILEPIEILGLDRFDDSAIIIKARIKTLAKQQWPVGRAFNLRMKEAFDRLDIEIPFPHQTLYFGVDKEGKAPPVRIQLDKENINSTSSA